MLVGLFPGSADPVILHHFEIPEEIESNWGWVKVFSFFVKDASFGVVPLFS